MTMRKLGRDAIRLRKMFPSARVPAGGKAKAVMANTKIVGSV